MSRYDQQMLIERAHEYNGYYERIAGAEERYAWETTAGDGGIDATR